MAEFKSWRSYESFRRRILEENRFVRAPEDEAFLQTVLETSTKRRETIQEGATFWRAQLGHDWGPIEEFRDGRWQPIKNHDGRVWEARCPYDQKRMIPSPRYVRDGRANPAGIAHLYLATNQKTAMAEVRPWLGAYVSLAMFKTKHPLTIIDCRKSHALRQKFYMSEPSAAIRERLVWRDIDRAFAEPVSAENATTSYAPTQVIAELLKNSGIDGIAYKSALDRNGYNLALFHLNAAEYVPQRASLHQLKSMTFRFEHTHD